MWKIFRYFLLLFMTFLMSGVSLFHARASGPPLAEPQRLLMAVMGDSISAATMADIPIPGGNDTEERVRAWADQGLSAQFIFENKKSLSWGSGREISSQYMLLKRSLRKQGEHRVLDVLNVSYPGHTSYDMEAQAQQVVDAMNSGQYAAIKYITLLIGANDACSSEVPGGTPLDKMQDNLHRAFKKLAEIRQKEPVRVLLVGIPRIPDLGTRAFRSATSVFGLSCEFVRNKILHFCDPLLLWNTEEEYFEKMLIVEDKNRLLRMSTQKINKEFPSLQVVYSNRLFQLEIPLGLLAADCFHPGKAGQNKLSMEVWQDQPWFF